jgi:hypothetical protein
LTAVESVTFQPGVRVVTLTVAFVIALAVSTSTLAPMRATADDLVAYRPEAGRFSVDLPGESLSVRELTGSKFSITSNDVQHTAFVGDAEFAVEIHDIPRVAKFLLPSDYILDRTIRGMLEDIGGREVDSVEASLQGEPAREVRYEIPDREFTGRLLLVLAGRRLYLVSVQHPQSIDPPSSIAPFFESFSFWLE